MTSGTEISTPKPTWTLILHI